MLRVGLIGTGDISNLNILGYIHSKDTELVAVADNDILIAAGKLECWGLKSLKIYEDYKKMIDKEDLDIVEILTPHHLHAPMTEYCAKAGIRGISVQKPMANTIMDCEMMINACNEEKVKLKLFENFRFYPIFLRAKELLEKGIIGEPLNFRINTIGMGGPSMTVGLRAYSWRINMDTCGGGPWVYDDGQHKLSVALWLMNEERVEKVHGWVDYFTGVLDCPANFFWKYPSRNPAALPKYGTMEFTLATNVYYPSNYYNCDEFIEISGTKGMMWINQCTAGGNFLSKTPQYPPIVVYVGGDVQIHGKDLPRDWRYSFINSTEHFIEVIKSGCGEPIYTGEQGKNLCIFGKMPYISSQEERIVYWEEFTSENEKKGAWSIKRPSTSQKSGMTKYYVRKSKDMKKGIKQGLKHENFKYDYES